MRLKTEILHLSFRILRSSQNCRVSPIGRGSPHMGALEREQRMSHQNPPSSPTHLLYHKSNCSSYPTPISAAKMGWGNTGVGGGEERTAIALLLFSVCLFLTWSL